MNPMLNPSETIENKAVLVLLPNNSTTIPERANTQAGQSYPFALFHHSPACTPCHMNYAR